MSDKAKRDAAWNFTLNPDPDKNFKWNTSQEQVLRDPRKQICRIQLVTGCGGSSKTALQIVKIRAATHYLGQYGLITSENNTVVDHLALKFLRNLRHQACSCVRKDEVIHPAGKRGLAQARAGVQRRKRH